MILSKENLIWFLRGSIERPIWRRNCTYSGFCLAHTKTRQWTHYILLRRTLINWLSMNRRLDWPGWNPDQETWFECTRQPSSDCAISRLRASTDTNIKLAVKFRHHNSSNWPIHQVEKCWMSPAVSRSRSHGAHVPWRANIFGLRPVMLRRVINVSKSNTRKVTNVYPQKKGWLSILGSFNRGSKKRPILEPIEDSKERFVMREYILP